MINQKGKKLAAILGLAVSLMLGGCMGKGEDTESQTGTGSTASKGTTEVHFLEEGNASEEENASGEGDAPGEDKVAWEDNSLDDFRAVINHPVKRIEAEGEIHGNGEIFVGEGGSTRHGNHTYGNYRKDWDSVNGITAEGDMFSFKVEVDPDREGAQVRNLGPVSGKNGYVACFHGYQDGKPSEYWFYELDENFCVVRSVQAKHEAHAFIRSLMGDADGNFHIMYDGADGKKNYVIISPEGETIFEKEAESRSELRAFGEGRVALGEMILETNERRFSEAKLETGGLSELAVSKDEKVKQKLMESVMDAVPMDEYRIAWCAKEGVCFYDIGSKETTVAYRWSNHGLLPISVEDMTVTADGSVAILYKDANEEGIRYLLLKPTGEKEELKSITIAVSPGNREEYEKAAAFFQKKYPAYVINIKDDYDETHLLTKLGAGDGPVLVDTTLTGFEDLERLWQPLDGFLEQAGLVDEMIPETLDLGKIGNVTYGIVRDFQIETLLVSDSGPGNWDYEEFLETLESHGGAALTNRYFEVPTDWREKYFDILRNGLWDNYYLNAETGTTIFGTPVFEHVLKLSQKAAKCPPAEEGQALREGAALCECTDIYSVLYAVRLRRRLEANGEKVIGYPTKNGGRNLLVARARLAMRSTATDEEKEIAYTFLKIYLSKEAMFESLSPFLPVRKDALEEEFKRYQETVDSYKMSGSNAPNFMPELEWDKDIKFLEDLIRNGTVQKSFPAGLQRVFDEELGDYLNGRIDGKALDDHLKSRVWLYLEEQK